MHVEFVIEFTQCVKGAMLRRNAGKTHIVNQHQTETIEEANGVNSVLDYADLALELLEVHTCLGPSIYPIRMWR